MPTGIAGGIEDVVQSMSNAIIYRKKQEALGQGADAIFEVVKRLELPDPADPSKKVPALKPDFVNAWSHMRSQQKASMKGYLEGVADSVRSADAAFAKMNYAQQLQEREKVPVVSPSGMKLNVPATTALAAELETPEREARTEHTRAQTEQLKREAAPEATVLMDLGGGNVAPVPINKIVSHP